MKRNKGFTLVELLVVIGILTVITLIAVPSIISNVDKSKQKSYNNQIISFEEAAERYSLEYSKEIDWKPVSDNSTMEFAEIKLSQLAEKSYIKNEVINPITNEKFPDEAVITVYKDEENNLRFYFEDDSIFSVINDVTSQYILKSTPYEDITKGIFVLDSNKNNITNSNDVTINTICLYNGVSESCENFTDISKRKIGLYEITYEVTYNNLTSITNRTIYVVEQQSPVITIDPDSTNKVDSVKVSITYPDGSKNKAYTSTKLGKKQYISTFEIDRNQTITATCTDKYGLECKPAVREITNIRPTIEGNPSIAVNWPNSTSFKIDIDGIDVVRGEGILEYNCKVGTINTGWSTSNTCNITGLTEETAYTVEVSVRDSKEPEYVKKITPTVYTAKVVAISNTTSKGTCPSNNNQVVSGDGIYPSVTINGSCSQTYSTVAVSSTITNSLNCGGSTTLTYSYSGKNYSSTTQSSCGVTSSKCNSSTSYYACSVPSYSSSGCSKNVSSGCSVLINSSSGCSKYVSSGCSVLINSASGCSKNVSSGCSVLINSASGCSKNVSSGCSVLINSSSGCSKYVSSGCNVNVNSTCSSTSYYGCSVGKPSSCTGTTCTSTSVYCASYVDTKCYEYSCASTKLVCGGNYVSSCCNYANVCIAYTSGGTCAKTSTSCVNPCSKCTNWVDSCVDLVCTSYGKSCVSEANKCVNYSSYTYSCTQSVYSSSGCSTTTTSSCLVPSYSANGCSSLSYYACSRSSYSANGCSSLSYYACSRSSYSASGCSSLSYYACSKSSYSASGCSSLSYYACSKSSYSASGCTSTSYYGCSVAVYSSSACSKGVCDGYTSYYTTKYSANIKFPSAYTVSYNSSLVKPKQSVYK